MTSNKLVDSLHRFVKARTPEQSVWIVLYLAGLV